MHFALFLKVQRYHYSTGPQIGTKMYKLRQCFLLVSMQISDRSNFTVKVADFCQNADIIC